MIDCIKEISKDIYEKSEHCQSLHDGKKINSILAYYIKEAIKTELQNQSIKDDQDDTITKVICGAALIQALPDHTFVDIKSVYDIVTTPIDRIEKYPYPYLRAHITVASVILNNKNSKDVISTIYHQFHGADDVKDQYKKYDTITQPI